MPDTESLESVPPQPTTITTKKKSIPINCRKQVGQLAKKTFQAMDLITKNGLEPEYAMMMANGGKIPSKYQVDNLKKNLEKYRLSTPRLAKLARNVVLDTLKGECREVTQQRIDKDGNVIDIKEQIVPSVTNQLAAASMVYDRIDPVTHQNVNVNINAEVSPVDLKRWINRGK